MQSLIQSQVEPIAAPEDIQDPPLNPVDKDFELQNMDESQSCGWKWIHSLRFSDTSEEQMKRPRLYSDIAPGLPNILSMNPTAKELMNQLRQD